LDIAWKDLQVISQQPHPYGSTSHDSVRQYILSRLAEFGSNVTVYDDTTSQIVGRSFFEGSNVIAQIGQGEDGLLVSGHFDSVQTSYGTTDDGHSIAVMLALVEFYAKNPPKRPIVFNFNTGEELGLFGAHAFFQHPASKSVAFFLNIEGAGAGGKAVIYRATDSQVASSFAGINLVGKGNTLEQDAYTSGVLGSYTDYEVYEAHGLRGLDLAFYKRRHHYHTPLDNPKYFSRASLYQVLTSAQYIVAAFANDDLNLHKPIEGGAFFDVFGIIFVVIHPVQLALINIALIVLAP
ncbi:hypothetical protein CANCADRAFT_18251, partial [Tortispora caseinolytica NRRL Y-17796]